MAAIYRQPVARLARNLGQAFISFANDLQETPANSVRVGSNPFGPYNLGSRQRRVVDVLLEQPAEWLTTRDVSLRAGDDDIPNTHTTLKRLQALGIVELQEPPQRWRLAEGFRTGD